VTSHLACRGRTGCQDTSAEATFGNLLRRAVCYDVLREILSFVGYSHSSECQHIEDCVHCKVKYVDTCRRELLHYGYFAHDRYRTVYCMFSSVVWPESTEDAWHLDLGGFTWAWNTGVRRVGAGLLSPAFIRRLLELSDARQFLSFYATVDPAQCKFGTKDLEALGAFLRDKVCRVEGPLPEDRRWHPPQGGHKREPPMMDKEGLEPQDRREAKITVRTHTGILPMSQKYISRMAREAHAAISALKTDWDVWVRPRLKIPVCAKTFDSSIEM